MSLENRVINPLWIKLVKCVYKIRIYVHHNIMVRWTIYRFNCFIIQWHLCVFICCTYTKSLPVSSSLQLDEEDFVAAASMELVKYKLWQMKIKKSRIVTLGATNDFEDNIDKSDLRIFFCFCLRLFFMLYVYKNIFNVSRQFIDKHVFRLIYFQRNHQVHTYYIWIYSHKQLIWLHTLLKFGRILS